MANAVADFFDRRLDGRTAPLAIGDLLVLALVFSGGTVRHNSLAYVLSNPGYLAATIAPFLLGWVIAAPLLGAYAPGAAESAKAAVPLALRSWVLADAVALAIRTALSPAGGLPPLSFVAVSLGTGLLGLAVWRTLFFKLR